MLFYLASFLVSVILGLVAYIEVTRYRFNQTFKHISGQKQYPVIGNLFAIKLNHISDFKNYVKDMVQEPITKMVLLDKTFLLVSDPHVLEQILGSNAFSDRIHFLSNFWKWNESLVMASYPTWKTLRKVCRPAFNHSRNISLIPIITKHFKQYDNYLEKLVKTKETFDFMDISVKVAMSQAFETLFDNPKMDPRISHELYEIVSENYTDRTVKSYYYTDFVYNQTAKFEENLKAYKALEEAFSELIASKASNNNLETDTRLIHMLIEARKDNRITDKQLMDTVAFIFNNNYETTSTTTAYLILMLAMHPEIDEKVYQEIQANYNSSNDILDQDVIKNLPYLDQVLKETLRLFPIPITMRQNKEEVFIDGLGLVPKGTMILPIFYQLHRWKHIWGPDAEKFNPDNFLPENVSKRHPASYLPFSMGPRKCIGYEYAQINLKLAMVHILNRFRFETHLKLDELGFKQGLTLKCNNKHLVKVFRRQ